MLKITNMCVSNIENYQLGQYLSYWLKDGNNVITISTSTPNFLKLSQYDTSNFIHEIPKHTKKHFFIKNRYDAWVIMKNGKTISGVKNI